MEGQYQLKPHKGKYVNAQLLGHGDVEDLPIVRVEKENGEKFVYSYWKTKNVWSRFRFLFKGQIIIGCVGVTQPPMCVLEGELHC